MAKECIACVKNEYLGCASHTNYLATASSGCIHGSICTLASSRVDSARSIAILAPCQRVRPIQKLSAGICFCPSRTLAGPDLRNSAAGAVVITTPVPILMEPCRRVTTWLAAHLTGAVAACTELQERRAGCTRVDEGDGSKRPHRPGPPCLHDCIPSPPAPSRPHPAP